VPIFPQKCSEGEITQNCITEVMIQTEKGQTGPYLFEILSCVNYTKVLKSDYHHHQQATCLCHFEFVLILCAITDCITIELLYY